MFVEAVYNERGVLRMEVLEEVLKGRWRSGNSNKFKGGGCDVVSVLELCGPLAQTSAVK